MSNTTKKWPINVYGSADLQTIAGYRPNNNWDDLRKHLTYQLQETIEQVVAFNERNQEDFRDATADIRVLLDAQQSSVSWSLEDDYNEVVGKLYTRFDKNEEDAHATQEKYKNLGVATYIVHDEKTGLYVNRVLESVDGTDGEHYPKDKWLKSVHFELPKFELEPTQDSGDSKITAVKNGETFAVIGTIDQIREWLANNEPA